MSEGASSPLRSTSPLRSWVSAGLLLAALVAGLFLGWRLGGPPDLSRWDGAIDRAAAESGVDRALLAAMVAAESGGRPLATSAKGARGLLQVLPSTAWEEAGRLGLETSDEADLYVPETNLRLGASYMARLLARYDGSEAFALAAYNAGPTTLARWRARMPHASPLEVVLQEGYEETRRHVVRVLRWRSSYEK